MNGIQVKYDTIFCYIVPLYPTDECLQEITDFIWNNLYERKDIKILIVYNVKAVVDTFYHIHNSNDWFQENQNNSLLFSKKINRQFLEAVLTWKGQTGGEVKLMSVGLVPEITSIMIGFYTEGGIFFHKEERGDDNRSINTFNSQQLRFDPAIAKLSQVVETSVVDRKHCIYLHIFPMYSYNPLALAEVREDSDEEEDEVDNEEENQQNEKIESPPSTFSQEQFLKFPSYEVKVTNNILYRLITTTEMKSSREILIQYKPLIRMYNKSKTIQFREPIVYHLSFVYNYKGIFHLFDPLRWDSNPQQPFSITTEDDNQSFHSSEVASFTQVDNLSSLYTKQSQDATGSNLKMIVKPVVNEVDYFEITFGPINGRVTSTEIRILFEFNMDLIELECSLIPTNQREEESVAQRNLFLSKRERIKKYNPVVFVFPNCIPDTLYNIFLPSLYPNKILGTVKTNPKVAMKTEVIFVGSHHYQNVPMKDLFLYQVQEYQSVNLYDLALLQNSSHEIQLIHPNNPHEIPSIFDLMDHNLIQSNQLDNILVFFHLDSLTFFTHYFEEMKRRCYELSKQYFQLLQLKEIQIEQERKEKEEEIQKIEAKFKKRIRGYKAGSGITEEVLKEIDQQIKEKRRNYDKELDDQLLNDYYLQQIVDIMTDTIRVIWSNPEVSKILSKSCHIPLFHTDYLLPNPVYSAADTSKRPDNTIDEEKEVLQFIRALFEKQVQLYVLELYGMDADRKNEIRVWELGPLLILLLDLASGRTKLKHPRSQSAFQGTKADEDDEEEGKGGKEAELKVVEESNDENKNDNDEGNEDGDEVEAKDKEEDDPDQEKEDEGPIKQLSKKQKGKRKPTEDEEGEASENRSKFPFSPGFIEKNQWKTIRKLCVDDKITQLIFATEDPLIPLQEIPNEFNFNEIDERFGESGKIPKGQVIPFTPTVKDLETFFTYWIQWIAKIRNASNNIESRSVIFVSKSKIPYSTTIQDLKTGIKLHQVCVGNYGLHIATPSEPTSHPEEMKNEDDFVMKGKIGTIKYVHSLKGQDYVRMTAFETEAKRNLKNRIKLAAEGEAADGEGEIKFESDSQRLFSEQAKRKKQQQRESHIKSKKKGIKRTIIDAGRIDELTGGKDGLDDAENNGTFGAEDLQRGDTEQPLVSRRRQYPSNMQGNVGYAQLKMWLDRWNPIGVWTNVDMNTVNKHHDITSGGKKGAGAGALGSGGKSNLTMSQKRKQMIEDGRRNEGLGRDGLLDGKEGKGKGEDEEDEDELEEAILLFGPIIGAPIVVATTASLASATADEDNEEEEEAEVQRERRNVLQNDEGNLDPQTKYHQDLQMKKKKLRIKIPIMIETDRGTNLVILLTPLFTPRKQHEFHIGNIPPSRPYVFELGPLALEERYQVTILSGLKPSPYNSFILSTHNNWDETNVIVINCELPDLTTNNANPNLVIQPSPFLMVDLFQRCAIPFHGINCIIHNNFQPNFDSLIENNGYSYQLKSKLFSYQQTKKISNDLRMEMNLLFNLFRNGFRDQYSRPSFRELLRAGMNLLIPQYSSLNDYLQMNAPEVTAQKKNQRRKGKKKKLSPFMIALNQKKAEEAAKEEARKLNPSKMNGILLLQLIEQRVIQEYIDTLRYPSCNVYRAVIDTANDDQYADYQQHTLQFVKPNHRIQNELIDQFNQLYNVNYRAEMNAAAAAAAAANKKTRKSLNVPRFSGFKSSAVIEVDLSYSKSDRFQLIWSDPVDDPVDAVLKQWAIAAIPAPTQWLPYYSMNEKLSIESISLIHSYQVPESPVVAATEPEKPAEKAPSRTGYALELPKGPNYVSYHTKDFTNHRAINSIQALSKVDIQSYVRIVIANNKRFFSSLLSREQQNALNKSVFEALMKEKNILNLTNFLLTNLNSPERATRKNSVLIPTRRTSTANNAPATSVAAPPPAENTPAEAAPAPDTTPAAETTPTKNDTEEDKNAAAEEIDDTIPSMILNPHQQVMLQFTTLFTLLEEWKKQFFGRQYLLCLPIQFPSLGTRAEDLYCVTEQDINLMITNFENYEADATNKFSRRKSVVEFTTLLTENVPHFTTEIQKLSIYLIDSIYRSNEYERNTILSDRRLTIPKKKINLSQLKSKRAQKKKQEEEMKQMKQILAEIEEISTKQIADGYLLIQAQSMKVFTDVTRTSRDSKHASFFAKGDMNNTGEGVISPRGGRRKSIGNVGDEIAEKKEEGHISPFGSPREFLTGLMGSPRDKPDTNAIEEVPSFVAVAPIKETVMDVITTVTIQIIGDKLMMQKQFEEQYPYTVSQSLPPTDSLKIVNPLFEEEYSNKKFDLLQLPNWFPFIFPIDETIFIEDEIWFIMKQQTKLSKLLELFEKMFAFLSSSSSTGTIVAANREGTADLVQSSSSSNYYQVLYQQLLKEYELSRLYELSLPEDLREIDFNLSGNTAIFFKDFVTQLWYSRQKRVPSMNLILEEDGEKGEQNPSVGGVSQSNREGEGNGSSSGRRRSARESFVLSSEMRHYMLNLSDDFIRSFCFSKSFHQITFQNLLAVNTNPRDRGGEGGAGFATQEELMEYLAVNKEKFDNFYHHSPENVQSILSSRQLLMKATITALYYSMVMRMGRTIAINEKYSYLLQRKDRIARLLETIERIERKLFLQKLQEDKDLLSIEAADRVLEMIQDIPTNAKQKKARADKLKEKEKEEKAKAKAIAEGSAGAEKTAADALPPTEKESRQYLIFITPQEEEDLIAQFNDQYEQQFNQELANIEYIREEYDPIDNLEEEQELLSPRDKANLIKETDAMVRQQLQKRQEEQKEQRAKEIKVNNLMDLTAEELNEHEATMFQSISEEEVKALHAYRQKTALESSQPLLDKVMELILLDAIDQLTAQLIQENIVFPNYDLNEENRRTKAAVRVQRMTRQNQLQRRKYGKRITFLQFK